MMGRLPVVVTPSLAQQTNNETRSDGADGQQVSFRERLPRLVVVIVSL